MTANPSAAPACRNSLRWIDMVPASSSRLSTVGVDARSAVENGASRCRRLGASRLPGRRDRAAVTERSGTLVGFLSPRDVLEVGANLGELVVRVAVIGVPP